MFRRYTKAFERAIADDLVPDETVLAAIRGFAPGGMAWYYGLAVLVAGAIVLGLGQGVGLAFAALGIVLIGFLAAARTGVKPPLLAVGVTTRRVLIYRAGELSDVPVELLRQYPRDTVGTIDSHRTSLKQDVVIRLLNGGADRFEAAVRAPVYELASALGNLDP